jgi:hypothetical protein
MAETQRLVPPEINTAEGTMNALTPAPDDPGGAHRKGYSADSQPGAAVPEDGPVPLADPFQSGAQARRPNEGSFPPTGRRESGPFAPNDRLLGPDRS